LRSCRIAALENALGRIAVQAFSRFSVDQNLDPSIRPETLFVLSLRRFGFRRCPPAHASVFFLKAFHSARTIDQFLLAREKRMATGTDFDVQDVAFVSGAGCERASARADHSDFVIIGMNVFLHEIQLFPFRIGCGFTEPDPDQGGYNTTNHLLLYRPRREVSTFCTRGRAE